MGTGLWSGNPWPLRESNADSSVAQHIDQSIQSTKWARRPPYIALCAHFKLPSILSDISSYRPLSPWNRNFLKNLIVVQAVRNSSPFVGPEGSYRGFKTERLASCIQLIPSSHNIFSRTILILYCSWASTSGFPSKIILALIKQLKMPSNWQKQGGPASRKLCSSHVFLEDRHVEDHNVVRRRGSLIF
jgi:hypothetical protein